MFGLRGLRGGADRAKADALHLREQYGAQAEAWCEAALTAMPATDPRRKSIQNIAKALRLVPAAGPDRLKERAAADLKRPAFEARRGFRPRTL